MTEETSKVDNLSDTLYSRTRYKNPLEKRSGVKEGEVPEVEERWQGSALDEILLRERKPDQSHPFMKKFFLFSVLFFAAAVVIAGIVFFGGVNFVSSKNVDINVVGPTNASAGEILELGVTVENKNNTDLELANFSVTFPQGSRDPKDSSKTLTYTREELGLVKAGGEVVRSVAVVLIGSMGESKELKFSVEYKVKGSNATFYKEKLYPVTIGNTPITLKITSPESVASGESFDTEVAVTLNSTEVLKNVLMRAEYPYGYSVTEATPQAVSDNSLWALGDISPGVTKKIRIKGKLTGENQEERTFRFYVGVSENQSLSPNFKTVVLSDQKTVMIERPAVGLSILFNGESSSTYIAPAGKSIQTTVKFQNNLSEKLLNPHLEVRLTGASLDKSSVRAENGGDVNSSTNRINWSLANIQGLSELSPGEGGQVAFSFASLPGVNQDIGVQFTLTGTPVGSLQALTINESRSVKVASQITLASRTVYSLGPFVNSGPTPPKAAATTTYSVIWSVGNTQGEVSGAKVSARLGANVKWVGSKSFVAEEISYDEKTNMVTWNLGALSSEAGFSTPAREVAFQVALTPVTSQIGTTPTLVTNIVFSGTDNSTGRVLNLTNSPLTTRMPTDPAFIQGDDIVVK